jgi:hypothetical protein
VCILFGLYHKGAVDCTKSCRFVSRTFSMYRTTQFMCRQMQTELRQVLFSDCKTMHTAKAGGQYLLHKHNDSSCRTGTVGCVPADNGSVL